MSIQGRIQNWLGISDIFRSINNHAEYQQAQFDRIEVQLNVITPGLGRVVAKLDTTYVSSEFSPERQAKSDRLGEEALKRLAAEAKARKPYK